MCGEEAIKGRRYLNDTSNNDTKDTPLDLEENGAVAEHQEAIVEGDGEVAEGEDAHQLEETIRGEGTHSIGYKDSHGKQGIYVAREVAVRVHPHRLTAKRELTEGVAAAWIEHVNRQLRHGEKTQDVQLVSWR